MYRDICCNTPGCLAPLYSIFTQVVYIPDGQGLHPEDDHLSRVINTAAPDLLVNFGHKPLKLRARRHYEMHYSGPIGGGEESRVQAKSLHEERCAAVPVGFGEFSDVR